MIETDADIEIETEREAQNNDEGDIEICDDDGHSDIEIMNMILLLYDGRLREGHNVIIKRSNANFLLFIVWSQEYNL